MVTRKFLGIACCILLLSTSQAQALNILLTNDDGYDFPWIKVLHNSLQEAGYKVTMVAPADDQSGQAAALPFAEFQRGRLRVDNPGPGVFAVHSTPAAAVFVGVMQILGERPDLVISGVNDTANLGVMSSFSGTVGATIASIHLMGVPAIAISANRIEREAKHDSEANMAHAGHIADFVARLVAKLEANREERGGLLPQGIALNVNYPGVAPEEIKGVGVYRHGRDISEILAAILTPEELEFAKNTIQMEVPTARTKSKPRIDSDTSAFRKGYITIVPIDGDYTAGGGENLFPSDFFENLAPRKQATNP